jgi:CheY-like chemotaxis protein
MSEGEAPSSGALLPATAAEVLVCDDHPMIRRLITELLARAGHRTREADSVDSAWEELTKKLPDLLIIDLHLGTQSGTELIARIRGNPQLAALPVVLLSGDFDGEVSWAEQLGADAVLPKPFDLDAFTQTVDRLLERSA